MTNQIKVYFQPNGSAFILGFEGTEQQIIDLHTMLFNWGCLSGELTWNDNKLFATVTGQNWPRFVRNLRMMFQQFAIMAGIERHQPYGNERAEQWLSAMIKRKLISRRELARDAYIDRLCREFERDLQVA